MVRYCLMFQLPIFLVQRAGMSAVKAGIMASIFDMAGVAGGILSGIVSDSIAGGRMITVTFPMILLTSLSLFVYSMTKSSSGTVNAMCMALCGLFIAGPDGILGGAASRNLGDYNAQPSSVCSAISGTVNAMGSIGAIFQGFLTAGLVGLVGWSGLFQVLGGLMLLGGLALLPAIQLERKVFAPQ